MDIIASEEGLALYWVSFCVAAVAKQCCWAGAGSRPAERTTRVETYTEGDIVANLWIQVFSGEPSEQGKSCPLMWRRRRHVHVLLPVLAQCRQPSLVAMTDAVPHGCTDFTLRTSSDCGPSFDDVWEAWSRIRTRAEENVRPPTFCRTASENARTE